MENCDLKETASLHGEEYVIEIETHDVGAVTAAKLVHAVRGRAGAADAPGVAWVAGSTDVAGLEEVVGALGR